MTHFALLVELISAAAYLLGALAVTLSALIFRSHGNVAALMRPLS